MIYVIHTYHVYHMNHICHKRWRITIRQGQKRCAAARAIASVSIEIGLDLESQWPSLWASLCAVHVTYQCVGDEEAEFMKAMSISINSAATRVRPGIGTWVYNLRFRLQKDATATGTCLDLYNSQHKSSLVSQLTKKETYAAITMVGWMPEHLVRIVLEYLKRVPPRKAVFNLESLQSPALRVGYFPDRSSAKFKELLETKDASLSQAVLRMIRDSEAMPTFYRKPKPQDETTETILCANLLFNSVESAKPDVGGSVLVSMMAAANDAMQTGVFDTEIK